MDDAKHEAGDDVPPTACIEDTRRPRPAECTRADIAPRIRRVFDGVPNLVAVGVCRPIDGSGTAGERWLVLFHADEAPDASRAAAAARAHSFARIVGFSHVMVASSPWGPPDWVEVIYRRPAPEWDRWKARHDAWLAAAESEPPT